MPSSAEWPIFLGIVAVYALAPGPALVYVLARSMNGGRREGVLSALGNSLGTMAHVVATAIGLSAVVAGSSTVYTTVKLIGATYLVYLGVQTVRRGRDVSASAAGLRRPACGARSPLVQGMIVEALNPSTALFFVALFPQFVDPSRAESRATVTILGLVVVAAALAADLAVVFAASRLHRRLSDRAHRLDLGVVAGTLFIALGVFAALR